jgi:hypothetical protein
MTMCKEIFHVLYVLKVLSVFSFSTLSLVGKVLGGVLL